LTSGLSTDYQRVMTHSDLGPENIIVLHTEPNAIGITGLIDWKLSGIYPEYWEFMKAYAHVRWSSSDRYSYLAIEVIGNHIEAWR